MKRTIIIIVKLLMLPVWLVCGWAAYLLVGILVLITDPENARMYFGWGFIKSIFTKLINPFYTKK